MNTGTPIDGRLSGVAIEHGRKLIFAYRAGHVKRWHRQGWMLREDSVARHSHNVAMIIDVLHPDPSRALLRAALRHDLGELHVGDIPRYAKDASVSLGVAAEGLEAITLLDHDMEYMSALNPASDIAWLNAADALDAWMVLYENVMRGNSPLGAQWEKLTNIIREKCLNGAWPKQIGDAMHAMLPFNKWSED